MICWAIGNWLNWCQKKKKFSHEILPLWVLNLGPRLFRSNALLSELSRHVLPRISFIVFCYWTTSIAQRGDHQIQMAEVLGSMLTGITFCYWIFCFSIVVNVGNLVKNLMVCGTFPAAFKFFQIVWIQEKLWNLLKTIFSHFNPSCADRNYCLPAGPACRTIFWLPEHPISTKDHSSIGYPVSTPDTNYQSLFRWPQLQ